jgi:hypothetical protein
LLERRSGMRQPRDMLEDGGVGHSDRSAMLRFYASGCGARTFACRVPRFSATLV